MERKKSGNTDEVTVNILSNVMGKEPEIISKSNQRITETPESINTSHDDQFLKSFSQQGNQDLSEGKADQQCSIRQTSVSQNLNQLNCEAESKDSYKALPPCSEMLKRDDAIKYKVRLKETMAFWLKEKGCLSKTKIDRLKSGSEHPSPFILAKFAEKAYKDYDKDYDKDLPEGWKLLTTSINNSENNGYFGAVFWNPKHQQVVIAHRGSNLLKWAHIRTDIIGIVFNNCVVQMSSASTFAAHVTSELIKLNKELKTNFQLFFTGHSLGGWLAQITTFTVKYLFLSNEDNFKLIEANHKGFHAHAVVFDSPGCKDMLNKLIYDFILRYDESYPVSIDTLDITSYLSAPNLINTCNFHVGTIYRVFIDLSDMTLLEKHTVFYNFATHKMDKILKAFDSEDVKIRKVLDWPISWWVAGKEWKKFFEQAKHLNDYDPKEDLYEFQATIRYQERNVEENIRNVNVFDQAERVFLEKYQQLRDLPGNWKQQNLFSDVKDEDTTKDKGKEIKERLRYFKIDSKRITCHDKGELLKLIPYVNALLHFFPEVKSQIDEALTKTGIMEAIIDSQSKGYLETISKYLQLLTEDEELKTLIRNTQQVSLISAEEETSMGLARIYKAFAGNTAYDSTKHIWKLEKLLYLKELFYSKKSMTSLVDVLCQIKSLVLVECTLSFKLEDNKDLIGDFLYCIFQKIKRHPETKMIFVVNSSNNGNWDDMIGSKAKELQILYKMEKGISPTWGNLSDEFQKELLDRPLIAFEGQKETSLKELMGDNNAAYKDIVSDKEMLLALINNIKIPMDLDLPIASDYDARYYMERWFNRQIEIDIDTFKERNSDDLLVSSDFDKEHLGKLGFAVEKIRLFTENDFTKKSAHKFIIGEKIQAEDAFAQLRKEYPHDNFHCLIFESDKLIWYQTQGDISNLHRHIKKEESCTRKYSENELLDKNQRIIIISNTPGMGKSVILTKMAIKIKEQKPDSWVIRINLNDHTKELNKQKDKGGFKSQDKNKAAELAIRFIAQALLNFGKSSKQVLCHHYCRLNMDKMILMLDGFDEISPDYKEVVIDLLQALLKTTIKQIWITTRPNMRENLENAFQQFAYTLKPFSEDEQQDFLTEFWQKTLNEINNEKLQTYARALIKQLITSIRNKDKGFTGIPLHTKLLAEDFQDKCAEFCKSKETEPQLSAKLDIIDLYEGFLQQKFKMWQEEKSKLDLSNIGAKRQSEFYSDFIEKHQDMALYALFNKAQLEILLRDKICEEFKIEHPCVTENPQVLEQIYEGLFKEKIKKIIFLISKIKEGNENKGVIDQVINDKPHFVHLTFAEYLVARYLVSNLGNKAIAQFVVHEIWVQPNFEVIRAFFNDFLANKELLVKILDKQGIPNSMLNEYGEHIENLWLTNQCQLRNKEGFTILHIAALENNAEIVGFMLQSITNYRDVLNPLLEACVHNSISNHNALYIAAAMGHWKVVQYLVAYGANVNFRSGIIDSIGHSDSQCGNFKIIKYLIEKEAYVKVIMNNGDTIMHIASRSGILEIVKLLIEKKVDVDAKNEYGDTILHSAARSGNFEIVKHLVDKGAKVDTKNNHGDTILHSGARSGNLEIVKLLIDKRVDVDAKNEYGETILHSGARSGNLEMVKHLVDKGANVNAINKNGDTILHIGALSGNIEIVKYLVEQKANVNVKIEDSDAILHKCGEFSYSRRVKYLVEKGGYVKVVMNNGDTILHIASRSGILEIVKHLIKKGVDVDAINKYVNTILHIGARSGNFEIVKYLVEKGADVNAMNQDSDTILYAASRSGNLAIVKSLEENEAGVNAINKNGDTILHKGSKSDILEIVKYLVKKGADVNAVNKNGDPILHKGSESGNLEIVQYLVAKGADINGINEDGNIILHNGFRFAELAILKYLIEKAANVNALNKDGDGNRSRCCGFSYSETIKYLLDKGADVIDTNKDDWLVNNSSSSDNLEI